MYPLLRHFRAVQAPGSAASITTPTFVSKAGNTLVAVVTMFVNKFGTVTDSTGGTWLNAVGPSGSGSGFSKIFYLPNITGSATQTVTFTPTSSDIQAMVVYELEQVPITGILGNTAGNSTPSTPHTSPTITSGSGDEIFIAVGSNSSGSAGIPVVSDPNWQMIVSLANGSPEGIVTAYRLVPPGTTDSFTFTTSFGVAEGISIAAFKGNVTSVSAGGGSYAFA